MLKEKNIVNIHVRVVSDRTWEDMKASNTICTPPPQHRSGQCLIKAATGETASTPSVCSGRSKLEAFCGNQILPAETVSPEWASVEARGNCRLRRGNLNHVQKAQPMKLYSVAASWNIEGKLAKFWESLNVAKVTKYLEFRLLDSFGCTYYI